MSQNDSTNPKNPKIACDPASSIPATKSRKQDNMGEIIMPIRQPVDPLKDEATRIMSHRGGAVSARAELY